MNRSTNRILTTHQGSLPRPADILQMLIATQDSGKPDDQKAFDAAVNRAVAEQVKRQADLGIAILNDGEVSKYSYSSYVKDRLSGFGGETSARPFNANQATQQEFPEWAARSPAGGGAANLKRPAVNAPIEPKDLSQLHKDIATLKNATKGVKSSDIFMNSICPNNVTNQFPNQYYPNNEAYMFAVAEAMRPEYEAIANAGFILQMDSTEFSGGVSRRSAQASAQDVRKELALGVETLNHATRNIPADKMRLHVCWGNNESPHNHDVEFKLLIDLLLKARPMGLTFQNANPRHDHEWKIWKDQKLPEGKVLFPGTIDTTCNFIEHPELVQQRIERFASVVGRENVVATGDCGLQSNFRMATVDPRIGWEKLRSIVQGAELASKELWKK